MAARTRSSKPARPRRGAAATLSVVLGVLAVAALPAAILASQLAEQLKLLEGVAVGVGFSLGLAVLALVSLRLTRRAIRRTIRPGRIQSTARWGRRLALLGLYIGVTGGLALAFYAALKAAE